MLSSIINLYMIPNLFFSFTVSISVDLSILNIPYKSISVNLPKYSPSKNFFKGMEKSMPQST